MGMPFVTIYIETSIRSPARGRAAGEWIAEYVTGAGEPITRDGIICHDMTTENALALELLRDALSILRRPCSILVYTECGHILDATRNHWPQRWEAMGWEGAKGRQIRNAGLWQQVHALMGRHLVTFDSGWHAHRGGMQRDLCIELGGRCKA